MKIKTYGINGLSEWQGDVKAGSISVKVSFTGGTVSPSGAQPAYFVTKDPITQFVIENSKEFKDGFIHLEMVQEVPGDHPRMATPKPATSEVAGSGAPECDETEKITDATKTDETNDENSKTSDEIVNVATKGDAVEWLKEHYPEEGYTSVKLRGKAFDEACKKHGVVFEIER